MIERIQCIEVDNPRKSNSALPPPSPIEKSVFNPYIRTRGLEIQNLDPKILENTDVLRLRRGGDGTTAFNLNLFGQLEALNDLVIWHEGRGSANTTLKGLVRSQPVKIPEHLAEIFPKEDFEARLYHPLTRETEEGIEYGTYLAGFGHLSINTTQLREQIGKLLPQFSIHQLYVASGLLSATSLAAKLGKATQPETVSYKNNGRQKYVAGLLAACEAITIPNLGTFEFENNVDPGKIRLLTISAESRSGLIPKYMLTLIVGALFSDGPDRTIRIGLAQAKDVDEVTVYLRKPEKGNSPNVCYDGELGRRGGEVRINRNKEGIIFIMSRKLVNEVKSKNKYK